MKTIYLINTGKFGYHKDIIRDFTDVVPGDILDMSDGTDYGLRYQQICKLRPDVVITFDLSGHVLRTGSDTLSLNNIYAKTAHILFHKTEYYGRDLKARQNLSMFTYVTGGENTGDCRRNCPDVPNISELQGIRYKPSDEDEHAKNREIIGLWWDEFKRKP